MHCHILIHCSLNVVLLAPPPPSLFLSPYPTTPTPPLLPLTHPLPARASIAWSTWDARVALGPVSAHCARRAHLPLHPWRAGVAREAHRALVALETNKQIGCILA